MTSTAGSPPGRPSGSKRAAWGRLLRRKRRAAAGSINRAAAGDRVKLRTEAP
jgi:hypothetical protein